jgi:uncharacterized phage protein (TIGR01671 family)
MREMKFRAWDVKKGAWFCCMTAMLFDRVQGGTFLSNLGDEITLWEPDVIFEQYTGLNDKNERGIYEGDLVKSDWDGRISQIMFGEFNYDNDMSSECTIVGFYWGNRENNDICGFGLDCDGKTDKYIVMGNIHENPELING